MFKFKTLEVTQVGKFKEVISQEATPEIASIPDYDLPKDNPFGAVSKGTKVTAAKPKEAHNQYKVLVTCSDTKQTHEFEYNDSIHNWEQGITELDEENLKGAFYCLMSDALAGAQSKDVIDFIEEFGYEDLRKGQKVYDFCNQCAKDLEAKFNLDENALCDLFNEFQEKFDY